jgi:hypothetical protein
MGGEIDARSVIGSGTEFRVRLPIEQKGTEDEGEETAMAGSGGKA